MLMVDQLFVPAVSAASMQAITNALITIPGVHSVNVNLAEQAVRVIHDDRVNSADLIRTLQIAGYPGALLLV